MAISYTAAKPQPAPTFKPLPPGEYNFKVVDAVEKTSKKQPDGTGGNQMIEVTLRVAKGKADDDSPKVWDFLVFTNKALWKVNQFMASVGLEQEEGKTIDIDANDLIGEVGRLSLSIERVDGKERNKVESYIFDQF